MLLGLPACLAVGVITAILWSAIKWYKTGYDSHPAGNLLCEVSCFFLYSKTEGVSHGRLVTKFKYLKPDQEKPIGGYATYIATREGVEKIDESFKLAPATVKQQKLIEKILRDFPDSAAMLEYEDYQREKTMGTASEFITRAIEDNAHEILNQKTYADYIGTRPGAERFGSHGLFTDDGVQVKLKEVSQPWYLDSGVSGKDEEL